MADQTIRDLRHAVRSLLRDRGFTVTTLATLALCLAANAAIFAVVQAVILRPLPFPEPERLVTIQNSYPGAGAPIADNGVPDYDDRRRETTAFEEIALYRTSGSTVGGDGGEPERLTSMLATPSFFRILRASPHRGRLFTDADGEVGQHEKVLLSYGLWQRLFAGQESAVGQTLRVNGVVYTVVGVMPADFRFVSNEVQFWTPAAFTAAERADDRRHSNSWQMLARLKPETSIATAQQQIDALNARNLDRFPHFKEVLVNAGFHTGVFGFHDNLVRESRGTLWLLWAFATFVLLIGALNVANLVSVRATAQVRELVTRLALGASLGALTRQILTEALVLTSMGGALGLLLGWWALRAAPVLGLDALAARHRNRPRRLGRRLHPGSGGRRRHAGGDRAGDAAAQCRCRRGHSGRGPLGHGHPPHAGGAPRAGGRTGGLRASCSWSAPDFCWRASIGFWPSTPASKPRASSPVASRCRWPATRTIKPYAPPMTACSRPCGPSRA